MATLLILPIIPNALSPLSRGGIICTWLCADVFRQSVHAITSPIGQKLREHGHYHMENMD
ncbi:hypothetical protein [Ktedonobacter sp. SOSP1-52]|uniref:hypothetical protein n=1 Tax=Ktedonobacter sp. SOSP1-52 TaxID=2778366 RepID=UPI00191541DB|nr:hypothetical protein [Ktedonobacter sp. SOSP1-52]